MQLYYVRMIACQPVVQQLSKDVLLVKRWSGRSPVYELDGDLLPSLFV
jgi:hypothetical protein